MNVQITKSNDIWSYNPLTEGYSEDAVFSAITGTPTISSNKLRLNEDTIITYDKTFKDGSLEMVITVPTAPTTGDVRQFGLKNADGDLKGAMLFDVTDDVFTAKIYDASGTLIASKVINWNADWTADEATFRITWANRQVFFAVRNVIVARFTSNGDIASTVQMARHPMYLYLKNVNADNMDVSLITFA